MLSDTVGKNLFIFVIPTGYLSFDEEMMWRNESEGNKKNSLFKNMLISYQIPLRKWNEEEIKF